MREILCYGDSNTYGLIPGTKSRYDYKLRWSGKVDQLVKKYDHRILEEGLCGRTSVFDDPRRAGRNGAELLPILLESHTPLAGVVLMLGTNDCKQCYHADAVMISEGMERLIRQIYQYHHECKILLVSPICLGQDIWKEEYDEEFDQQSILVSMELKEQYRALAEKYECAYLAASDYATPSCVDMEHMDQDGHASLAEAIYHKLEEIFSWT